MIKKKIVSVSISLLNYALVIAILSLPAIAAAQEANQNVGSRLTSGRLASLTILLVGVVGLFVGYRSNKRSAAAPGKKGKKEAIIAYVLGLVCIILSAIRVINTSGFGTGGGKAGSIIALIVGGITIVVATITLTRNQTSKSN